MTNPGDRIDFGLIVKNDEQIKKLAVNIGLIAAMLGDVLSTKHLSDNDRMEYLAALVDIVNSVNTILQTATIPFPRGGLINP